MKILSKPIDPQYDKEYYLDYKFTCPNCGTQLRLEQIDLFNIKTQTCIFKRTRHNKPLKLSYIICPNCGEKIFLDKPVRCPFGGWACNINGKSFKGGL